MHSIWSGHGSVKTKHKRMHSDPTFHRVNKFTLFVSEKNWQLTHLPPSRTITVQRQRKHWKVQSVFPDSSAVILSSQPVVLQPC